MLSESLSEWLGWTSIACWLGAQFPQVIENYKRKSVEGLALPFLANWLFGDITNLVGCLLTNQLPFQTYLATYFVFVDASLITQYFYYTSRYPKPKSEGRFAHSRSRATSLSHDREAAHYRTISNVAANVAAAAALASQQEAHLSPRVSRRVTDDSLRDDFADEPEPDEDALAALTESFHSEGARTLRGKRVSWSQERYEPVRGGSLGRRAPTMSPVMRMQSPGDGADFDPLGRGRSLTREEEEADLAETIKRRSSRASRRGAGLVFLGVWALLGVGTLTGKVSVPVALMRRDTHVGRVLGGAEDVMPVFPTQTSSAPTHFGTPLPLEELVTLPVITTNPDEPEEEAPSMERVIGRIFAWVCTTLYLTSRLPQIWKNFIRKSVEGLSVYLFIFAFLGNAFYVASILTSPAMDQPAPAAVAFLKESLPYLMGSGGTLVFDVTIVAQSFLYSRPGRRRGHGHGRERTGSRAYVEEATGLLTEETAGPRESA